MGGKRFGQILRKRARERERRRPVVWKMQKMDETALKAEHETRDKEAVVVFEGKGFVCVCLSL